MLRSMENPVNGWRSKYIVIIREIIKYILNWYNIQKIWRSCLLPWASLLYTHINNSLIFNVFEITVVASIFVVMQWKWTTLENFSNRLLKFRRIYELLCVHLGSEKNKGKPPDLYVWHFKRLKANPVIEIV